MNSNFLESIVSRKIADKTNIWYKCESMGNIPEETINLSESEILDYYQEQTNQWIFIVQDWPIEITPIFVNYEDILKDPLKEVKYLVLIYLNIKEKKIRIR